MNGERPGPAPTPKDFAREGRGRAPAPMGATPEAATPQPRRMLFVDRDEGVTELAVKSEKVASFIGRHHHAIRRRLRGDERALEPFEDKRIRARGAVYNPETDIDALVDLYWAGDLDFRDPGDIDFRDRRSPTPGWD